MDGFRPIGGATAAKPYPVHAVDITITAAVSGVRREFDVAWQCASSGGGGADECIGKFTWEQRGTSCARSRARNCFLPVARASMRNSRARWWNERGRANPSHEKGLILRETEELVFPTTE